MLSNSKIGACEGGRDVSVDKDTGAVPRCSAEKGIKDLSQNNLSFEAQIYVRFD